MTCLSCSARFNIDEQLPDCPHPFRPGIRFDDSRRRGTCNVNGFVVAWESGNFFSQDLDVIELQGKPHRVRIVQDGGRHILLAQSAGQRRNAIFIQRPAVGMVVLSS